MTIYFYQKSTESAQDFAPILENHSLENENLQWLAEQKRSFELWNDLLQHQLQADDVVVIQALSDLGIGKTDILNQLQWFLHHETILLILSVPASYQSQWCVETNHAVLETVLLVVQQCGPAVLSIPPSHKNSGRKSIPFPENWEFLYQQWTQKRISSQEFIQKSGLRKGTFYHLLAEYERIQEENKIFWDTYRFGS